MGKQPRTLIEHMYVRAEGSTFNRFKESGRVFALVQLWAAAQIDLGTDDVRPEAFKAWAADVQSVSTTERQMQTFRRMFKGEQTPNRLANELRQIATKRGEELDAMMRVSDSLLLA